jgi:hypothetical protein
MKTVATASLLLALSTSSAFGAEPTHVVIDPSDQHTTTFVGIPKALPAEQFQKLKESLAERKGAYLVTWQEFSADPPRHVRPFVRRNDYPEVDVVGGLTQLLGRYDGTSFGLTWNGGLAVTLNDYRYSGRTYAAYLQDPNSFKRPDRKADPVHPSNHLEPLLAK